MALGSREFVEEVEKYYDLIEQKRKAKKEELKLSPNQRLKISLIDIEEYENDIFEITVALHRLFIMQPNINNLSNEDTEKVIKKAKLLAFAGVISVFKRFDNKNWNNFWQFYSNEASLSINDSFFDKIIKSALIDESLIIKKLDRNDTYTDMIARESILPDSIIVDILYIFKLYKKYFYPTLLIKDFFKELNEKDRHNMLSLIPDEIAKNEASQIYKRLSEIKDKTTETLVELMRFTNYINIGVKPLDKNTLNDYLNQYKEKFGIDISEVFKTDELRELFLGIFPTYYSFQFKLFLNEFDENIKVILPDNTSKTVLELKQQESLDFGEYKIESKTFVITPNQSKELDFFLNLSKEKIHIQANKAMIISDSEIETYLGTIKTLNQPSKIYSHGKQEGYLWYGNKPLLDPLSVLNDEGEIDSYQPTENLISNLSLKLKGKERNPYFELDLDYLLIVSKENKGKKVKIIDTEQNNDSKEFIIDNVGYSGKIPFKIKSKKSGLVTLYLTSNDQPLELKDFESRLNFDVENYILFDSHTNNKINPSAKPYFGCSNKLYLFTTKEFDPKWINDVCEVSVYQNFGRFNVYEIDWLDTSKALELNINSYFKWRFNNSCTFDYTVKHNNYQNSKYISYGKNYFHNIKDIHLNLTPNCEAIKVGNIDIKVSFNYDVVSPNMKLGAVNDLLGKDFNSTEIDENVIKALLPSYKELSYGRYDFEFSYEDSSLLKYSAFVIPDFEITEGKDVYIEGDDVILTLSSHTPCFRNGKTLQNYLFDEPAKCNFSMNPNKMIEFKKSHYHKVAKLYNPYVEIPLKYDPEIVGYRFMQDNRLYQTDRLDYYDIDKNSLVIKASQRDSRLKINGNSVKNLIPNNSGIILEPIVSSKSDISKNSNDVTIQIGKNELDFEIVWNTKVSKLACENVFYSSEQGISFLMSYEGANQSTLKFIMTDDKGKSLDIRKITSGDDTAPKFVRYDRQKNCVLITCDGRKWENRQFTFHLDPKVIGELENIFLEGIYEDNKETFGKLVFRNEEAYPELKDINDRLREEENNPYTYFERGFLYSEMNLFILAEKDFNKSLKLGLDDEEANSYIEIFKDSQINNLLTYELSQITRLARKLYTDELLLEVE